MAVKTIFLSITGQLSAEAAFMMQAKGLEEKYRAELVGERERQETELDEALSEGFTVLHAGQVDSTRGSFFAFVLYKPNDGHRDAHPVPEEMELLPI